MRWRSSDDRDVLEELRCVDTDLVVWRRALPTEATLLNVDAWANIDAHLTAAEAARALEGSPLAADVVMLLERFQRVTGAARPRLSLSLIRGDQCRRFHVDYVRFRMVTTYAGPGTEWLPEDAVDRGALEHPTQGCPLEANARVVRDPSAIRHATAGDVLIWKGSDHATSQGAVHRSPPIEGTGTRRLVLIVSC